MKYCPVCDERFDEEIIKFCTKDGTPLIEEAAPSFSALPSESVTEDDDELGQETVVRRREDLGMPTEQGERFVIPTTPAEQQVRPRTAQAYYPPPPPPSNTAKTVILTILGTLAAVGFGAGLFWIFSDREPANVNINTNPPNVNMNTNLNSNIGFDSNFNFNTNANYSTGYNGNFNFNAINANIKTPSPTQTPRPSPSPTASPTPRETPDDTPTPRPTISPRPANTASPAGTPRIGPRPPVMTSNRPPGNGN